MTIKEADNIINKEIFEFSYAEADQAFTLQKEMNDDLLSKIHLAIDSALNESFSHDEIIRINKLEIDLGEIPFTHLSELIPQRLHSHVKEKLQTVLIDRKKINDDPIQENEIHDPAKTIAYFLHTGTLPWWAGHPKKFSLSETINSLLKTNVSNLKTIISENISNEQFIKRLIYQLDQNALEQIFGLIPAMASLISIIENIISYSSTSPSQFQKTNTPGEISSLITSSKSQPNGNIENHLKKFDEDLQQKKQTDHSKKIIQIIIDLVTNQLPTGTDEELRSQLKEKILILFGGSIELDKLEISIDTLVTKQFHSYFDILKKEIAVERTLQQMQTNDLSIITSGEKKFIENAGLVLIATFLPALFKELQWLEDGKFKTKELQFKGIFLLHYMATGETAAPEYTLQLNKILMGLDLDEPIPFSVELTDRERQEADQLLNDIITHWTALKNSSVEGFQGSFILRDGLLSYNEGHWLLQVEKKGYDILLEHIPWSWKTIRFDWMQTYIDTEW